MGSFLRRVIIMFVVLLVSRDRAATSTLTVTYLQSVSDKCQETIDVYTDADDACNHFAARGEFDARQADLVMPMDEISPNVQCLEVTCITATFDPRLVQWGGWYFLNGVLGPTAREPSPNWGDQPNAGYDLTGSPALKFWAKGAVGGEVVHFFAFGVGNTAAPFQLFPDSSAKVELPNGGATLSTTWAQYLIPLAGLDIHYVLGGFGWVAVASEQASISSPITFYIDNIQYLKARPSDSRFLVSYETIKSTNSFDVVLRNAAYVYDNAVATIALIATGDLTHAKRIADALVYAQNHDRFFTDGRVRNAYQGGDIALPPGWLPNNLNDTVRMPGWYDPGHTTWFEDETQVSTNTGNVAWAGLALLNMWEVTKDPDYLAAAQALGDWVLSNASETRGGPAGLLGGFTGGYDGWENGAVSVGAATCASGVLVNGQCKRLYKSTEHNIDLYSMYSRLYLADPGGASKWANSAQQAKHFFLSMWDQGGKFWTGTAEDGVTLSTDVIPLDIQAWALQTLGAEAQAYLQSLEYVETNHKTSLGYGFKQNGGNACGDYTWFEGTSQVAVAYLLTNNTAKWQSILDGVHSVQVANGGIPATDGACLNTGFTLDDGSPWEYFPRIHVGATGWLALAENGVNPYRPELYSPQLSTSVISFGDQLLNSGTSRTVSFTNPGVGPLTIRGVSLGGANASDFSQSNTCGTSLPSGATCTITIFFAPTVAGSRSALLTVNESSDPAMVPTLLFVSLTGNGGAQLSLSGRVVDSNNAPVSGVLLTVTGSHPATATTAADGTFSLPGFLTTDTYTITPSKTGYTFVPPQSTGTVGNTSTFSFTGINGTFTVSGHATYQPGGGAAAGVVVTLTGSHSGTTTTAADGSYQFTGFQYGDNYGLSGSRPGYIVAPQGGGLLTNNVTFDLTVNTATLSGRVADSSNAPVSGVLLTVAGSHPATATTAADGTFSLPGFLTTDTYTITPSKTGYTFVPPQSTGTVGNTSTFSFTGINGTFTVSGHATYQPGGGAAAGVVVTLTGSHSGTTTTAADGSYQFTGFQYGDNYGLSGSKPGYIVAPQGGGLLTNNVTFDLTVNTATLSGRVADSSNAPVSGVLLTVTGSHPATATTAADGTFSLPGFLTTDTYTITPSKTGYTFVPPQSTGTVGNTSTFSFTGINGGFSYSISGRVTDTTGAGVSGVTLTMTGSHPATATTPADGSYSFTGFQPGDTYAITPSKTGYAFGPNSVSGTVTSGNVTINFTGGASSSGPTISSVAPASGTTGGGTQVSIFGSNFVSGATVHFGNTNAAVSQVSSSQIRATTPPGTGTVSITVVNPDGQSGVLSGAFTYQTTITNNPTILATTQACTVSGTVSGVNPPSAFAVVVYAFTNQYYVQACDLDPPATINSNGTWGPVQAHNGAISAILVRQGYVPASTLQSLPLPDGVNVFGVSNVAGTLSGCNVARCPAQ